MVNMAISTEKIPRESILVSMEQRVNEALDSLESVEWHAEHIKHESKTSITKIIGQLKQLKKTIVKEIEVNTE